MVRQVFWSLTTLVAGFLVASVAHSQTYPSRPIRVIVGFAPGGNVDIPARIVAPKLGELLGTPVVVENRVGAGGRLATDYVARIAPDGYTLLACGASSHGMGAALYAKRPYDPIKDFAPISLMGTIPNVLVVHPSVPVKSVGEFIAYIKSRPGKVGVGSAGIGSSQHMSLELFQSMTKTQLIHIPFKGGAQGLADLIGGQVSAMFSSLASAMPHIKSGKALPLGVTTAMRSSQLPDVPTIAESGVPGYDVLSWIGLCAPAGVSPAMVAKLNGSLLKVLEMPSVQKNLADQGYEVSPTSPERFADFIKIELAKGTMVVKIAGITPE